LGGTGQGASGACDSRELVRRAVRRIAACGMVYSVLAERTCRGPWFTPLDRSSAPVNPLRPCLDGIAAITLLVFPETFEGALEFTELLG
jgi:hypothetical protein